MQIGFSVSTQVNPFYKAMADGVRDQAKAEGMEVTVLNAEDKLEKQIADVEDLIQKQIDVLLINATHDGAAAVLNKAADAGIPVVTLQRAVPGAKVASHIGTDNVVIGREGAEWIAKKLNGKGNVVVMEGIPGAASSEDRKKGSAEVWPKHPGIKIVAQQSGKYDRAVALGVMENISRPSPRSTRCSASTTRWPGVLAAVKAAKRTGIMITGMDANKDAREAVEKGELAMTIALPPYDIGKRGCSTPSGSRPGAAGARPLCDAGELHHQVAHAGFHRIDPVPSGDRVGSSTPPGKAPPPIGTSLRRTHATHRVHRTRPDGTAHGPASPGGRARLTVWNRTEEKAKACWRRAQFGAPPPGAWPRPRMS
jgi:ribose transport system substrate-binding protein